MRPIIIIGYSGHSYVINDIFASQGRVVVGYCDQEEKAKNPYGLKYCGSENEEKFLRLSQDHDWFVAIASNKIRQNIFSALQEKGCEEATKAIHQSAIIGTQVSIGHGVMIAANVSVNAMVNVGKGAVLNTGCIVEHECRIGQFTHIAPGAVLTGNVTIGDGSFIGARAVIKPGIVIGNNATIGAGAVVLKDVPDNAVVFGNPAKLKP